MAGPILERRHVLAGAFALAALPAVTRAAPTKAFITLSSALIPVPTGGFDPDEAQAYEQALRAGPQAAAIGRLIALAEAAQGAALLDRIKSSGLEPAANLVVSAWYSGMVDGKTIAYVDALAWNAVPFTKPNGSCGGAFGYWSDPPG